MSNENDLIKLYSDRILSLATELSAPSRLSNPDGSVKKRSPLCGSTVTVDLSVQDNLVSEFAQDVKACALGQAAASVLEKSIIGCSLPDIERVRANLYDMLKNGGVTPTAPFEDMEFLRPAKDFKNRHASILLSVDATLEAIKIATNKKQYA